MANAKNAFNSYKRPVRPDAIPPQRLTDRTPRTGPLKEQALAAVDAITFKPKASEGNAPVVVVKKPGHLKGVSVISLN
jgi:hypothetical protein